MLLGYVALHFHTADFQAGSTEAFSVPLNHSTFWHNRKRIRDLSINLILVQ